uniref:Uncharacterized protein n=1 Tax=Megaselia scalaris TaxID=36166 RepID=T1H0Z4_MEGSC
MFMPMAWGRKNLCSPVRTWTSYGCEITICDANLSEQNLAEYSKHYEIGGVFDLYKTYYSDIKLLDKLSRISFPKVEYFVVFGYSSEENVSKKDVIFDRILYGLSGKFVQMDMDNISSCISDLDYLLGNIYNEVSRKVISKDHSSVETK